MYIYIRIYTLLHVHVHAHGMQCVCTPTQADKGEQSGFDVLLEKHLNGKNVMKDMAEFFRER